MSEPACPLLLDDDTCATLQFMIQLAADRLTGLRTQCLTSAPLTQQEIRRLENKLVKLFGEQLLLLRRKRRSSGGGDGAPHRCVTCSKYPCQRLWLRVVGLDAASVDWVCARSVSLEWLLSLTREQLADVLRPMKDPVGKCHLTAALSSLHQFIESSCATGCDSQMSQLSLHWDSWRSVAHLTKSLNTGDECQVSLGSPSLALDDVAVCARVSGQPLASTPSSISDGAVWCNSLLSSALSSDTLSSSTHKTSLNVSSSRQGTRTNLDSGGLTDLVDSATELSASPDDSGEGTGSASARNSPSGGAPNTPHSPRTPRTPTLPGSMSHVINHVFVNMFKVSTCDFCKKQIIYGVRCRECRYKCHKLCKRHVPPTCGLPKKFVDFFIDQVQNQGGSLSPNLRFSDGIKRLQESPRSSRHRTTFLGDSSSATSSCNSTAPSSPAFPCSAGTPVSVASSTSTVPDRFHFPDVTPPTPPEVAAADVAVCAQSADGGATAAAAVDTCVSTTDSERTLSQGRMDSQDSCGSDLSVVRQDSLSLREWDIPFEEVVLDELIGRGRLGPVHRGHWHGEVAVKLLAMHDQAALNRFKQDVATFRKTRHENLVLFMGACVCPPQLAIVTSYCTGYTLHTLLHVQREKFSLSRVCNIARHISLGMGYLHARDVVHKDLKTKNVFVDAAGSVVITDFGLFSLSRAERAARHESGLEIARGWLCCLSPELIRRLTTGDNTHLPFTAASDVFAFGTIWYELLSGEKPWLSQPPETIIFLAGLGMKPSLASVRASKQFKDIFMKCWSCDPEMRPDFVQLLAMIDKLSKRRLIRSPSHPVSLSRSVESVF